MLNKLLFALTIIVCTASSASAYTTIDQSFDIGSSINFSNLQNSAGAYLTTNGEIIQPSITTGSYCPLLWDPYTHALCNDSFSNILGFTDGQIGFGEYVIVFRNTGGAKSVTVQSGKLKVSNTTETEYFCIYDKNPNATTSFTSRFIATSKVSQNYVCPSYYNGFVNVNFLNQSPSSLINLPISSLSGSNLNNGAGITYGFQGASYPDDYYKQFPALDFSHDDLYGLFYTGSFNAGAEWFRYYLYPHFGSSYITDQSDPFAGAFSIDNQIYTTISVPININQNGTVNIGSKLFCPYAHTQSYLASYSRFNIILAPKNDFAQFACPINFSADATLISFNGLDPSIVPTTPQGPTQACYTGATVTSHNYTPLDYQSIYQDSETLNSGVNIYTAWRNDPGFFAFDTEKYYEVIPYSTSTGSIPGVMFNTGSLTLTNGSQNTSHSININMYATENQDTYPQSFDTEPLYNKDTALSNYIRIVADRSFTVSYRKMTTVKDGKYTKDLNWTDVPVDSDGYARIPISQFTRNYRIQFVQGVTPTIQSISWGKYTNINTLSQVCVNVEGSTGVPLLGPEAVTTSLNINKDLLKSITNNYNKQHNPNSVSDFTGIFTCPDRLKDINLGAFSFLDFGINFSIPFIDYNLDLKPFSAVACPLKSAVLFFQISKP